MNDAELYNFKICYDHHLCFELNLDCNDCLLEGVEIDDIEKGLGNVDMDI
ncbi:MAG: hypothetical protein NTV87_00100 [Ignavibacteriae bacterium]|nr:hypothetical protein [Ignavibacteriota bacterium]